MTVSRTLAGGANVRPECQPPPALSSSPSGFALLNSGNAVISGSARFPTRGVGFRADLPITLRVALVALAALAVVVAAVQPVLVRPDDPHLVPDVRAVEIPRAVGNARRVARVATRAAPTGLRGRRGRALLRGRRRLTRGPRRGRIRGAALTTGRRVGREGQVVGVEPLHVGVRGMVVAVLVHAGVVVAHQ